MTVQILSGTLLLLTELSAFLRELLVMKISHTKLSQGKISERHVRKDCDRRSLQSHSSGKTREETRDLSRSARFKLAFDSF